MAYKGKFNQQRHINDDAALNEENTSFADLDLGLDIDLSFLDEAPAAAPAVQQPQAPAAPEAPRKAPKTEKPEKKAMKKAEPAAPKASPVKEAPAKKATKPSDAAKMEAARKAAAQKLKAAPGQEGAAPKAPAKKAAAPAEAVRKQPAPAEPPKKKKKGPRVGSVIFYTMYFLFILAFFLGTYIGLQWLHGWLSDYELSQPTYKAEAVFQQLFTNPNWGDLYEAAGAQDSLYEGKEEYVNYMEAKVAGQKLNYMETSAGLSGDKKYLVRLGDEKVASFTLVDRNQVGEASLDDLESITDIADWTLGTVEVFFVREGSYRFEKVDGCTVYVNDVALDDSYTIQIATTMAESYLPEGTTGASMCLQQVDGIMELPTVKILDKDGNEAVVSYDEETRTFTQRTESNTITAEQEERALEASKTYCLWMIEEVTDRAKIAKYFDNASKPYKDITKLGELWMQGHAGYAFANEKVSKFASYGDDLFSVLVSMDLNVTRKDGSVKTYAFEKTLFFENQKGQWMIIDWTNVDVSQPVGKVRLTFMEGTTKLTSDFYTTDADEVITPIMPAPAGKVLAGWATITEEDGKTVYTLVFEPDETGRVALAEGTTLTPMTLYAVYEDAGAAEAAPAETEEGA